MRIGQTADGRVLAGYLRARFVNAALPLGASVGALREMEASRRLALEILTGLERQDDVDRRSPNATIEV